LNYLIDSTSKFGDFSIYESKDDNTRIKPRRIHVHAYGNALLTNYFDAYGNRDSLVAILYNPNYKKIVIPFSKKYKRKGKLEFLADEDGINYYKYNFFGRLKRIEYFRDTVLYRISTYQKNRLVHETFPTRKKYRKNFEYAYDKKGRIIKKDNDDYYFYRYEYNEFGLSREEKVYKRRDIVEEYILFTYDENGRLIRKKTYRRKNRLISEYFYKYE
jgi:YD repeat-containing protein